MQAKCDQEGKPFTLNVTLPEDRMMGFTIQRGGHNQQKLFVVEMEVRVCQYAVVLSTAVSKMVAAIEMPRDQTGHSVPEQES